RSRRREKAVQGFRDAGQAELCDNQPWRALPCRDGQRSWGQRPTRRTLFDRLDVDRADAVGGLDDDLRQAVEQRAPGLLVAFVAIGVAVAHTDQFAPTGNTESKLV